MKSGSTITRLMKSALVSGEYIIIEENLRGMTRFRRARGVAG